MRTTMREQGSSTCTPRPCSSMTAIPRISAAPVAVRGDRRWGWSRPLRRAHRRAAHAPLFPFGLVPLDTWNSSHLHTMARQVSRHHADRWLADIHQPPANPATWRGSPMAFTSLTSWCETNRMVMPRARSSCTLRMQRWRSRCRHTARLRPRAGFRIHVESPRANATAPSCARSTSSRAGSMNSQISA